jgi:CubicO group peptidase (beta-lactamase class C family)
MTNTRTGGPLDGSLHPDFQPVASAFEKQLENQPGGAAICVYHQGECVVDLWGGAMDSQGTPWQRDTLSPSFSTTKGVTSTLLHIMVDRGLIDYDARVAEYWPEFARAGKEKITVRQVLAHQSGLYHIRQMVDHAERMCDWDYMVTAIENTRPIHEPGERTGYHGLTYGYIVGEILQRVSGKSFCELVDLELSRPLELDGLYIGAPEAELSRAAELIWPKSSRYLRNLPSIEWPGWAEQAGSGFSSLLGRGLSAVGLKVDLKSIMDSFAPRGISDFDFGSHETLRHPIPAGNGLFTARSVARMYAMLAAGGEIDGVRLLEPETIERATEIQNEAPGRAVLPVDMRWRLGYHGVVTSRGVPRSAFGHFGFGGSGAWADPKRDLAVAMTVNCGMGTPLGDLRIVRIGGAALGSAQKRAPDERPSIQDSLESWGDAVWRSFGACTGQASQHN